MSRTLDRFLGASLVMFTCATAGRTSAADHPRGLHFRSDLEAIRQKVLSGREPWATAHRDLMSRANKALTYVPQPPADFDVPGYYGSDQQTHIKMKTLLSEDVSAAYACALAYHLATGADSSRRAAYGAKGAEILNSWAGVNRTVSGADGNLVMSYNGNKMAVAGDLLYNCPSLNRDRFTTWVRNVLLKSGDAIDGKSNNWGDWGTLAVIVSCCYLDDGGRLNAMTDQVRGRITASIAADGHLPAETSRGGNGMWYTYFALAPLTESALILQRTLGVDLLSTRVSSGQRVKKALDHFLPYCKNPGSWPYATVTNQPSATSPQGWPGNLYEGMGELYANQEYSQYAAQGRPHFRNSTGLAWVASTLFLGTFVTKPTAAEQGFRAAPVRGAPNPAVSCRIVVPSRSNPPDRLLVLTGRTSQRVRRQRGAAISVQTGLGTDEEPNPLLP